MKPVLKPLAAITAALLLGACAGGSRSLPPELVRLQNELARVEGDTRIPPHAGPELAEARRALDTLLADRRRMDDETFDHNVYLADRLIKIAEAEGLAGDAEARTSMLARERETLLLDARTRQADLATSRAEAERRAAEIARTEAEIARSEAEIARADADVALMQMDAMRARLAELETRETERGLVVTLGDVLFEVDRAELKPGATRTLGELVQVLRENPNSTVAVEGHTDSTGGREYNLSLSQRRAESVRNFLIGQGIEASRITAQGMGPDYPVATNNDAAGRQQNRRVELVIQDRPVG
jgi:outer membrane protein OmpA-like peptidoglycan-associated protein